MANTTTLKREVLIVLRGDIYEVSKFIPDHPGEGIHDVYLRQYHRRNGTEEYEKFHYDAAPDEYLEKARDLKHDPETGIYHVGQNVFKDKRRLPAYFFFLIQDKDGQIILDQSQNKTFIVKPKENGTNTLLIALKDDNGNIIRYDIQLNKEKNTWSTTVANNSIEAPTVEEIVEQVAIKQGFSPATINS